MRDTLKESDFYQVWENKGKGGLIAYSFIQLCSDLGLTVEEVEAKAKKDSNLARVVSLYRQKCKASILQALFKDPKNIAKYWELEYSNLNIDGDVDDYR